MRSSSSSRPTNDVSCDGQVAGERVERPQRRELACEARARDWNTRSGAREVAQPVLAEVDELDVGKRRRATSSSVACDTTIWPPCAAAISRAARFTAVP